MEKVNFKIFLLLLFPFTLHAKSYEVILSPCDIGSNCKKCYEVINLTYEVDMKSKQVFISGKGINGKDIREAIDTCQISDESNWICDSAQLVTNVKNGLITITNKPESIMMRNKMEICLIR